MSSSLSSGSLGEFPDNEELHNLSVGVLHWRGYGSTGSPACDNPTLWIAIILCARLGEPPRAALVSPYSGAAEKALRRQTGC